MRFGTADINRLYGVAVLPDGKIVTAGTIGMRSGSVDYDLFTARFNPDGSIDTTFGTGGRSPGIDVGSPANHAPTLLVQSDGKLVVGGGRGGTTSQSQVSFALGRFTADGLLDSSFGTGGAVFTAQPFGALVHPAARFRDLAQAPDGSIVANGSSPVE